MSRKVSPNHPVIQQRYLTEKEVAARLGMSVKWLQKSRLAGGADAIPFHKFGSAVRYSELEVHEYEQRCLRRSTSEGPR